MFPQLSGFNGSLITLNLIRELVDLDLGPLVSKRLLEILKNSGIFLDKRTAKLSLHSVYKDMGRMLR
jgi:hypothetical protein